MTVPAGWRIRRLDVEGDLDAVAALFAARDRAELGRVDLTPEELAHDWRHEEFDPATDAWVVEDPDGRVAAYADVFPGEGIVHGEILVPDAEPAELRTELLDRVTARAAGETLVVAVPKGSPRAEPLRAAGFTVGRVFLRMGIDLGGRRPSPPLPDGVELRPFDRTAHAAAVKDALDVAFTGHYAYEPLPFERWRDEQLGSPFFRDGTMFVAWSGDAVAGAALCFDEPDQGWVRHLGVLPEWRGRGLGAALLGVVFDRFAEQGKARVELGVDTENATNATRLYERAGMETVRHIELWEKRPAR